MLMESWVTYCCMLFGNRLFMMENIWSWIIRAREKLLSARCVRYENIRCAWWKITEKVTGLFIFGDFVHSYLIFLRAAYAPAAALYAPQSVVRSFLVRQWVDQRLALPLLPVQWQLRNSQRSHQTSFISVPLLLVLLLQRHPQLSTPHHTQLGFDLHLSSYLMRSLLQSVF